MRLIFMLLLHAFCADLLISPYADATRAFDAVDSMRLLRAARRLMLIATDARKTFMSSCAQQPRSAFCASVCHIDMRVYDAPPPRHTFLIFIFQSLAHHLLPGGHISFAAIFSSYLSLVHFAPPLRRRCCRRLLLMFRQKSALPRVYALPLLPFFRAAITVVAAAAAAAIVARCFRCCCCLLILMPPLQLMMLRRAEARMLMSLCAISIRACLLSIRPFLFSAAVYLYDAVDAAAS